MSESRHNTSSLYEIFNGEITNFVKSKISNSADAEDVAQEVFIRVHKGLSSLKDSEKVRPWLYQIARNTIIDFYRKQGRNIDAVELNDEISSSNKEGEGEENINAKVIDWFPYFISKLPEKYREAVALYELEGIPQQQIAEQLNMTVSGAKSRIQRGREQMKTLLMDCCTFEKDKSGNIIDFERNSSDCECDTELDL